MKYGNILSPVYIDRECKKLLLAAVPHIYREELKYKTLGYDNSTALELLTRIWYIYGTIDKDMITLNLAKINAS